MPDVLHLAATDALARALRERYALEQRERGLSVWESPHILSLSQWTIDAWAGSWPEQQLISTPQAQALWLQAVEADDTPVLSPLACAREALRAERLLLSYRLDPRRLPAYNREQQSWLRWRRAVRRRMTRSGWLLREELAGIVADWLRAGRLKLPPRIALHGFDPLPATPAEQVLLAALGARSEIIDEGAAAKPAGTTLGSGLRCADRETQYRLVAETVRRRLADTLPPARVVIVLPDAQAQREALEAALVERVAPWLRTPGETRGRPWRHTAGAPLADQAWIETAQAIFQLEIEDNDFTVLSRLLLSPVPWAADSAAAATLEARLRELGRPRLRLQTLLDLAPTALHPPLAALRETLRTQPRRAWPSDWAAHFEHRLQAIRWPGATPLPSSLFQRVRELHRRLARLGAFDAMLGRVDAAVARLWLGELLREGFEPWAEHEQPVTVAEPDQALALPCDLLIVCDATTETFPGRAKTTPFIAIEAQRAVGVPAAHADTHLASLRQRVRALCGHAREVLVMAPATDERGANCLPSRLFPVEWEPAPALTPTTVPERLAVRTDAMLLPDTDPVPPVAPDDGVRGDAALFTAWFESPFFALCTHRLGVAALPQVGRGLSASAQGQILHAALDALWAELQTSARLNALDEDSLTEAVDRALAGPLARRLPAREVGRALVALELGRMRDLLRQWLHHERRRVDPFRVLAREADLHAELAGLPLRLRIDRADVVHTPAGDRYLLLDYKTGREADPRGWNADRLRDPQLPLYATLATGALTGLPRVDGIGFAHLKDGHPALSVACNWTASLLEAEVAPKRDWEQQVAAWSERLYAAAREFMAGRADFDAAALGSRTRYGWLLPLAGDGGVSGEPEDNGGGET